VVQNHTVNHKGAKLRLCQPENPFNNIETPFHFYLFAKLWICCKRGVYFPAGAPIGVTQIELIHALLKQFILTLD